MAEPQTQQRDYTQSQTAKGNPSTSNVLVLAALVPFGASLLVLAGLTLTATVIGLAVVTPLFVIFSPVLLPAALVIGLAIAGFLTSGAFGITSLSSFGWLATYLRRSRSPEQPQREKSPARDIADHVAQKTEEAGDKGVREAQETGQEAQKETAPKAQEAQKETGETRKAREENKKASS
ncbi:Oleosin 5 [Spatholobus suberectus]|nr:Oleosin 5 [Spatholobus suberectus]